MFMKCGAVDNKKLLLSCFQTQWKKRTKYKENI